MITVILSHKVKNYVDWRPLFDADFDRRSNFGFRNEKVFKAVDDPNHLYIRVEADDRSAVDKLLNDPGLAEKMAEGGVIGKPLVTILEPA